MGTRYEINRNKNYLILFAVFFIVLFYVWIQITSERLGYRVENLRTELNDKEEDNKRLKIAVNELSSPKRLDAMANRLNMQLPSKSQIVDIVK
jgi:cell division protein FtsL